MGLTWRTIKLVWRASPVATSVLAALTLVSSVLPLGVAYAGKGIVDGVVAVSAHATMRWVLIELGDRGRAGADAARARVRAAAAGRAARRRHQRRDPGEGADAGAAPLRGRASSTTAL